MKKMRMKKARAARAGAIVTERFRTIPDWIWKSAAVVGRWVVGDLLKAWFGL